MIYDIYIYLLTYIYTYIYTYLYIYTIYHTLTRKRKRDHERMRAEELCRLAQTEPSKFWRCFKSKAKDLKIKDKDTWEKHFKKLLSQPCENEVSQTCQAEHPFYRVLMREQAKSLNVMITREEVEDAVKKLKRNKACGIDGMKAELILEGQDQLVRPITDVFNKIFEGGFPDSWSVGVITPIFKKGDPTDPGNYRGITLVPILSKLYAIILNTRLSEWSEQHGCRADTQAGFRKDHRCSDNVLILRTLIEKCKANKKPLYCCYVDFSKAFDTLPCKQLWNRLEDLGIHGCMLNAIKSYYANVQTCVATPSGHTGLFGCTMGVKQGCPLSPLLFGFYIDKLAKALQDTHCDAPNLCGHPIPGLFFTDHSTLLSWSENGLQIAINKMEQFCDSHGLTVNASKTKIVVYGGGEKGKWTYKGCQLERVTAYKCLGLLIHAKKHLASNCALELANSAKRALHALISRCSSLHVESPTLQCALFDILVRPKLYYGCEIWGVDSRMQVPQGSGSTPASLGEEPTANTSEAGEGWLGFGGKAPDEQEKLHLYFLKKVLCVSKSTPSSIVLAEFGRLPLYVYKWKQIMNYWNRLVVMDENRLLKKAFIESHTLHLQGKQSWVNFFIRNMTCMQIPFSGLSTCHVPTIIHNIENYTAAWWNSLSSGSIKLQTYQQMRPRDYVAQSYLKKVKDRVAFKCLASSGQGLIGSKSSEVGSLDSKEVLECASYVVLA